MTRDRLLKTNLFDHLAGATPAFIKSLTVEECTSLVNIYARGFVGLSRMDDAKQAPLAREALDDLHQSASQLTATSPNYGFSRWASLQAAEKLLKSFITLKQQMPRKTHNLVDLAATAVSLGLPAPSSSGTFNVMQRCAIPPAVLESRKHCRHTMLLSRWPPRLHRFCRLSLVG